MKNCINDLIKNPLFNGCDTLDKLLPQLASRVVQFKQDDYIIFSGNTVKDIGIVLYGNIKVIKENINGNINIVSELSKGQIFAEAFLCAGIIISPVTVQATTDCEILFIDFERVHNEPKLISNMLRIIAQKSIMLSQKIEIMAGRTIREKLLLFFNSYKVNETSTENKISSSIVKVIIPYNREELAHYLCVDRSAMSRELCKMRDEGLIRFRKNIFEIY